MAKMPLSECEKTYLPSKSSTRKRPSSPSPTTLFPISDDPLPHLRLRRLSVHSSPSPTSLDVNQFTGEIPPEIFQLKFLSKINISRNDLIGTIPSTLSRCDSLTSIDFSQNNLSGEIPSGIAGLHILGVANLSRNQISGQIPTEIRSMTSLITLDLSYNNFSGRIPVGGQFLAFNGSTFVGNPNLCSPLRHIPCPSIQTPAMDAERRKLSSKIIVTIVVAGSMRWESKAWKLTPFQKLGFKVDDVIECLKEENIIGKGGAGTVYRGTMPDGVDVAIKRLVGRSSGRSDYGFSAEIQTPGIIDSVMFIVRVPLFPLNLLPINLDWLPYMGRVYW